MLMQLSSKDKTLLWQAGLYFQPTVQQGLVLYMAGHGTKSLLMTPSIKQYFIYYELETLPEEFIVSEVGKEWRKTGMAYQS